MFNSGHNNKLFPGKNTFFCWGRCVCAKDFQGGILCLILLIITGGLFFGTDCPYLATNVSLAIPIVGAVLWVSIIAALLQTFLMDPGILPRPPDREIRETERLYYLDHPGEPPENDSGKKPHWFMEVDIRGRKFKLVYCRTCKMYRPPRAIHCSRCDNCIERFDHHCTLVGNCVGKRNYRYFYTFITLTSIMCCYVIGCNITVIVLRSNNASVMEAINTSLTSLIESIICLFSLATVGGLTCYHTGLLSRGVTTNEDLKGVFNAARVRNAFNPYDRGSCPANWVYMFCAARTPSLLDRSCFVTMPEVVTESNTVVESQHVEVVEGGQVTASR